MSRFRADRRNVRGGAWRSVSPAEAALDALAPDYQFRADTATLAGGNVATVLNRRGADSMIVGGTIAAPIADSSFGGAQALTTSGAQHMQSSLAASDWKFLHDGTGCTVVHVYQASNVTTYRTLSATLLSSTGHDFYAVAGANGPPEARVYDGSVFLFDSIGVEPDTSPTYACMMHGGTPLKRTLSRRESVVVSGAYTGAPPSANPDITLRLLGGNGPFGFIGKWCETLIWRRVMSHDEWQTVREYMAARYAIAASVPSGMVEGSIVIAGQSNAQYLAESEFAVPPAQASLLYDYLGGSSLYVHWQAGHASKLRANLLAQVATAPTGKRLTILWLQGEGDQEYGATAVNAYVANFTALQNEVAFAAGTTDVRWIISYISGAGRYGVNSPIRQKQELIVATLPGCAGLVTDGYAMRDDLHYTDAAFQGLWNDAVQIMKATP